MRWFGFLVLALLPGSWVTFSLPLPGVERWTRWVLGIALGPLVVCAQFYVLRLLGASFGVVVPLLVVVNLPPLYLILRGASKPRPPNGPQLALLLVIFLVPIVCLLPQLVRDSMRMYFGHPWVHTSVMYLIANGELVPEDPELAGVRLFYPWAGHAYQAVVSYLIGSPPFYNYIWANLLQFICVGALAVLITKEMGGDRLAQATSTVWLFFGVNFAGYSIQAIVPSSIAQSHVWGDYRFTPWMWKFISLNQMPVAMVMLAALVYLSIRPRPAVVAIGNSILIGLFLCGIGIIYPILFPAAAGIVGARFLAVLLVDDETRGKWNLKDLASILLPLAFAGAISLAHYEFIGRDRVATAMDFSQFGRAILKAITFVVVTGPLLVGLVFALRRSWAAKREAVITQLAGASASFFLYAALALPYWDNEYKFMFSAAACLAVFPALALQELPDWLRRKPVLVFLVLAGLLGLPYFSKVRTEWPATVAGPSLDRQAFRVRLAGPAPLSLLCDAIREQTPVNAILVMATEPIHFPTLAGRPLYVPPEQSKVFPGVDVGSDVLLLGIRGYPKEIVGGRRRDLRDLFRPNSSEERSAALKRMLALQRPVGIVLNSESDGALLEWLKTEGKGQALYESPHWALWLILPASPQGN